MPVIAVAGGTGSGLGRSITLQCASNQNHKVIVITRLTSKIPQWLQESGIEVRRVDYNDSSTLKEALKGVDTVISTLMALNSEEWISTQVNLVDAGVEVGITRFVPSDWGLGPKTPPQVKLLTAHVAVWDHLKEVKQRHEGKFEWASFHLGGFMNYLGQGCPNKEALNGLADDGTLIWRVDKMVAKLPLNREGKTPKTTLTELGDVGRFVSAACDLPFGSWKEHMGMVGDVVNVEEVVEIIAKVRGKKMHVEYRSFEKIQQEEEEIKVEDDPIANLWLGLELSIARDVDGEAHFYPDLNELVGDKVKPMKVKEYIEKYWSGV